MHNHPIGTYCSNDCPIVRYVRMSSADLYRLARAKDSNASYELSARGL